MERKVATGQSDRQARPGILVSMNERELLAKIEEKDAHLRTLAEMSVEMNSFRSLAELVHFVATKASELVDADKVSIMLADPQNERLSIVASTGIEESVVEKMHLRKGEGIAGKVWETRQPVSVADISSDARYVPTMKGRAIPEASLLSVPIQDSKEFFGAINVQRGDDPFDEEERNLLTLIAVHTAGSIRNVRLVTDLEERIQNIRAAQEIGNLLVSTFDVDTVLTLIVRGIRDVTGAEACSIMLWDEHEQNLLIRASVGIPDKVVQRVRVRRGENIAGWVAERGEPLLIRNLNEDPRFKGTAGNRYCNNSVLSVPMKAKGKVLGVINVNNLTTVRVFNANDVNLLMLFANQAAIALENARLYQELEKLAITDGLTGLANHRTFQDRLIVELARASRFQQEVSLLIVDIDHFKSVNDQYGHQMGDLVLRSVAARLKDLLRKMDFVARYGGEEFTIIMPQTHKARAYQTAERLRESISKESFFPDEPNKHVTISLGLAEFPSDANDANDLIEAADQALYSSKRNGRNRVTTANPETFLEEMKRPLGEGI
jgi:diguanylate cyclase (GGDEF)-like protein